MSEVYDGVPAERGENRPDLERLSLSEMSKVLIELDGTPHYTEHGQPFQNTTWYDPEEAGKYYILEQAVRPAGSFNYSLRIFCGDNVTEHYDFQDGIRRVYNRLCTYAEGVSVDLLSMEYDHAADCLRAELARRNYTPPIAPEDTIRGTPITETDNNLFFDIVNGFAK